LKADCGIIRLKAETMEPIPHHNQIRASARFDGK